MAVDAGTDGPQAVCPASAAQAEVYTVERVDAAAISPGEFTSRYVNRCTPVVLTGAMESWPAYGRWNLDFFKTQHGGAEVSVDWGCVGPDRWRKMTLGEYIDNFAAYKHRASDGGGATVPYLRTWNALDDVPELRGQYAAPDHFVDGFQRLSEDARPPFEWLFIGPAGAKTTLHEDIWGTDAWLAQLQGRKHFQLYHPAHRRYLERDGVFVNPSNPDLTAFPEFHSATAVETILLPGEVIYIPRRWPHYVVGLDDTVSVTINFMSKVNHKAVFVLLSKYIRRRKTCERILGRPLRARDNLMKFCCHGGQMPAEMARRMLELVNAGDSSSESDAEEPEAAA